jgi:diacylglycerol kinase family enzyme
MRQTLIFPERICCVINPEAANKKWQRKRLLRKNLKRIFPVDIIDNQHDKHQTIQEVRKLCKNHDVIVVAGGDGTIADVIQGIMESSLNDKITLGIIPLGSGNAFRKTLGIPRNIRESVFLIATAKTKVMDLVDIEGQPVAFASIGATAQISMERQRYRVPGLLGYILSSYNVLKIPRKEVEVDLYDGIDDRGRAFEHKKLKVKMFDCVIGKTSHFGYGWRIAPKAKVNDGYIDITFFQTLGYKYLLFFPTIYFGIYQKTQIHFKAKRILIRGEKLPIQYHGEILGIKDNIELKIIPKALKIISPDQSS